MQNKKFNDCISEKTASLLKSKSMLLLCLIQYTRELQAILQSQYFEHVVCHADIHGWNLLITPDNYLYLIDWDTIILAPKERDLMFIGAGIWNTGYTYSQEKFSFYKGYGASKVNKDAILYYRLERIFEDISAYCQHIFLSQESFSARMQSLEYIKANFLPNGTIEMACIQDNLRNIL